MTRNCIVEIGASVLRLLSKNHATRRVESKCLSVREELPALSGHLGRVVPISVRDAGAVRQHCARLAGHVEDLMS
jgi:hypothetical protein